MISAVEGDPGITDGMDVISCGRLDGMRLARTDDRSSRRLDLRLPFRVRRLSRLPISWLSDS
jgi:hypothetical protein